MIQDDRSIRSRYSICAACTAAITSIFVCAAAVAQEPEQRNSQLQLLDIWQARVALRESENRWQNTQSLFERGLVANEDYIKDRTAYEAALIAFRRSAITAFDMLSDLTIESAVKLQDENGAKFVRLAIRNRAPKKKSQELLQHLAKDDSALVESLRLDELRQVYVSLKDLGTTAVAGQQSAFVNPNSEVIIAKPYEALIRALPAGKVVTLRFRLLKDIENVIVSLRTVGRTESRTIKLEYDSASAVTANSAQFSQEADLGQTASFDLLIERGAAGSGVFGLSVEGLPGQIRHEFLDPSTSARLSEINFLAGVTSKQLNLRLYLPDTPGELKLDRAIRFSAVITPSPATSGQKKVAQAATVELQLIPRGRGELQLALDSLYFETEPQKPIKTTMKVRNIGTRRLDNARFTADVPARWQALIEPNFLSRLEVNEEQLVHLTIDTSLAATRGEFSVRLQSQVTSGNTPLEVDDQVLRVKIIERSNLLWIGTLFAVLVLIMGSAVAIAIRISRR